MSFPSVNPVETIAWSKLKLHFDEMKFVCMKEMFANDTERADKFHIRYNDFLFDYSKNRITETTMQLLLDLANEVELDKAITGLFTGEKINQTENRAVLHTALRANCDETIFVDGKNVIPEILEVKKKIKAFSECVISGAFKGYTGKAITDVVNIGVGGSDLGPAMVTEALHYYKNHLNLHFVSNIDGDHVNEVLKKLNPETTLFIVVSKSFTTQETLSNASTVREWFLQTATLKDVEKHFVAVSVNLDKTTEFGILDANVFPMWDWVGGRYSLWSAVGLIIALGIGYENFEQLLLGAQKMDKHFQSTPFEKNMPVVMALLSVWYNNFFEAESEAVIPYSQYLQKFTPYLQQGIMESNGKSTSRVGDFVNYHTGTIIWGEPGTNCQHAFFQLIHQGTKLIPVDFIGFKKSLHGNLEHHNKLMANFFAQSEALLNGRSQDEVLAEMRAKSTEEIQQSIVVPHKIFKGNKPTNTLLIEVLTPESLGALIALYEHKTFVQGVIWNIFSYDQWGVELGKELATNILEEFNTAVVEEHDSSTRFLLKNFLS
ncbi:glucose-6-phosphate isomerase [Flavobacterium sp.]|uniref:glucose-6-phosphate isomerase n=1 Tax=Flavobacterium sp. TaxID=239 RepID=UPI003D11A0BB